VYALLGAQPRTEWLPDTIERDEHGFLLTGEALSRRGRGSAEWATAGRAPASLETSVPGVLAAGDVRAGSVKRVASAVGEGATASRFVRERLIATS
jgi:thioredoxin reductase (NADPH)